MTALLDRSNRTTSTSAGANTGRTLAALAGLTLTLPVDLALVGVAFLRRTRNPLAHRSIGSRQTVLISGGKMTKALQLARSFHSAGHRVVLVESAKYRFTGHRFSRAVDAFHCVPEPTAPGYAEALLDVVRRERVDVFVPVSSPAASVYDAYAGQLVGDFCEVVHVDVDTVQMLDDKATFSRAAAALGLRVPDFHRITDAQEVVDFAFPPARSYILKRIAYNPVGRMDLTRLSRETPERNAAFARSLSISTDDPWILQEFVSGQEYCTHGTVRDGALQVYGCCESSAFQINYEHVEKPEIRSWVETFVRALNVTGQLSFDFIEADDGHAYAIECNPRTHSAITMFYDHPQVAAAYLDGGHPVITPRPDARPTYWIYHELWRLLTQPGRRRGRLATILRGTDAIFTWWDPLPYLMVHHLQIPSLLVANLRSRRGWTRIDFNIGKLVEPGGGLMALSVLHLVGSAVDEFHAELSRLYAGSCLAALLDPERYEVQLAYVSPDGSWRFPADLGADAVASAVPMSIAEAITHLTVLHVDVVVPQMFCLPGMTSYRGLFDVLGIPYLGNPPEVMANAADKAVARAIVAAAGVAVPEGDVLRPGEWSSLPLPVVVKPVGADNSVGVSLVRDPGEYDAAVELALDHGGAALVESYVELGREVRCGIIVRDGELVCLPLEEYAVDPVTKPIRGRDDKLGRSDDGDLYLVAKEATRAWIVAEDDPITERVWEAARRCHVALGCRHYSLFDFRIDPDGKPWFLEAGPYCSFAPTSVIAVMAAAAGLDVAELFAAVIRELETESAPCLPTTR